MNERWLEKIVDYKKQELAHQKRGISLRDVQRKAQDAGPVRDFLGALTRPFGKLRATLSREGERAKGSECVCVIAEIKKASPSAGVIRSDFNPVSLAQIFEDHGAAALSILTDEHFFQGSLDFLGKIREKARLPLLRKDFVFDEYQIYEARGAGADAILLIVRILSPAQLKDYQDLAHELGMTALVEVHDEKEVSRTEKIGVKLVGINNRSLDTFKVDLETTVKLMKYCRGEVVPSPGRGNRTPTFVSESGINSPADIERLRQVGVHAFLIGESLLREKDPGRKLKELLAL